MRLSPSPISNGTQPTFIFLWSLISLHWLTRNFALERLRYGNHDRSASYVQRIRAVSKEDVLNAARKYIRPDNMQVIVLGEDAFELE